jgi:hypothetical protein
MALYLVLSVHTVCQLYKTITIVLLSQPLKAKKPYWVTSAKYDKEYRNPFENSLDQLYIILLYLYSIIICINAWQLAPGFMIGQTCFVITIEVILLEILHMRFLLTSSNVYMGYKAYDDLKEKIKEEVHEQKIHCLKNIFNLTIVIIARNLIIYTPIVNLIFHRTT